MYYAPDIMHRYSMLLGNQQVHTKVLDTLMSVFWERSTIENGYAINLEQLAKTLDIQEDGQLNEDVVGLVQHYRSLVICEQQQAEYLRDSLRNDIIPAVKSLLQKQDQQIKMIENKSRDLDKQLKTSMHNLTRSASRFRQSIVDQQYATDIKIKDTIQLERVAHQRHLEQSLSQYNNNLDEYFEGCAKQHLTYQYVEKQRRNCIRDLFMKIQVFWVSMVKNVEYNLKKLNDRIEVFTPDIPVYNYILNEEMPMLNKFNINNYLQQIEEDVTNQGPSLNLKQKQATQEIKQLWGKLKKTMNMNSNYDALITQFIANGSKIDDSFFIKISQSEEELDLFLNAIYNYTLPEAAKTQLIPLNKVLQALHRLVVDSIQYLYTRSMTDYTLRITKTILTKYEGLPVVPELKDQVNLYIDNIKQLPCLHDTQFCYQHFITKINQQYGIDTQPVARPEMLAEVKFQSIKLLKHHIPLKVIQDAILQLQLTAEESKQIINYIDTKQQ